MSHTTQHAIVNSAIPANDNTVRVNDPAVGDAVTYTNNPEAPVIVDDKSKTGKRGKLSTVLHKVIDKVTHHGDHHEGTVHPDTPIINENKHTDTHHNNTDTHHTNTETHHTNTETHHNNQPGYEEGYNFHTPLDGSTEVDHDVAHYYGKQLWKPLQPTKRHDKKISKEAQKGNKKAAKQEHREGVKENIKEKLHLGHENKHHNTNVNDSNYNHDNQGINQGNMNQGMHQGNMNQGMNQGNMNQGMNQGNMEDHSYGSQDQIRGFLNKNVEEARELGEKFGTTSPMGHNTKEHNMKEMGRTDGNSNYEKSSRE